MSGAGPYAEGAPRLAWQRAKACSGGQCLEVAKEKSGKVLVRNNTAPNEVVQLSATAFREFVAGVEAGDFRFQ